MKVVKTITIDSDLYYKVKESGMNFSEMVNNYLKEHFEMKSENVRENEEMIKNIIAKKEAELLLARDALKTAEEKRIKEKGVPFKLSGW